MKKQYRGQNPFLKALYEDPNTLKRYNFSWFVRNEHDVSKPLYTGSLNYRCKDNRKEQDERVMKILEQIKKKYRLPSTEVINFAIRRVQR
jgi:hypothetical protein